MIYFVLNEQVNAVYIGIHSDKVLQVYNASELKLIVKISGGLEQKHYLHKQFANYHIFNDWFEYSGIIKDYLIGLLTTPTKLKPINVSVEEKKQELYKHFINNADCRIPVQLLQKYIKQNQIKGLKTNQLIRYDKVAELFNCSIISVYTDNVEIKYVDGLDFKQ